MVAGFAAFGSGAGLWWEDGHDFGKCWGVRIVAVDTIVTFAGAAGQIPVAGHASV